MRAERGQLRPPPRRLATHQLPALVWPALPQVWEALTYRLFKWTVCPHPPHAGTPLSRCCPPDGAGSSRSVLSSSTGSIPTLPASLPWGLLRFQCFLTLPSPFYYVLQLLNLFAFL